MKDFILIKCFGQYPTDQDLIRQIDYTSILGNKAIGGIPNVFLSVFSINLAIVNRIYGLN